MNPRLNDVLTPAQIRAYRRALAMPDKIILGRIVMAESAAETLVRMGLWEKFYEVPRNSKKAQPRYRFTAAGRAALEASDA